MSPGCPKAGAPVRAERFAVLARVGGCMADFTAPTAETTPPSTGTEPTTVRAMVETSGLLTTFATFLIALKAFPKMLTCSPDAR